MSQELWNQRIDKLLDPDKDIINFSLGNFHWMVSQLDWTKIAQPELLINWEREQVDTCPQVKKCTTNLGLSYSASNCRTTRFLYLTGIGSDSSSLMLVAKKTFFLGAHVLKKFCIWRNLFDSIKKWHINFHLIKYLNYLLHVCILFVCLKTIWKCYYRLVFFQTRQIWMEWS